MITALFALNLTLKAQYAPPENITDRLSWQDNDSAKILVIKLTAKGDIGSKSWNNQIYAYFGIKGKKSLTKISEIRQRTNSMECIDYVRHSIKTIALDSSNTRYGCFFYELFQDQFKDNPLKLVCFYRQTKIIISGNVPKQRGRANKIRWTAEKPADVEPAVIQKLASDWLVEAKKRMKQHIADMK